VATAAREHRSGQLGQIRRALVDVAALATPSECTLANASRGDEAAAASYTCTNL
jgi:hypothetical protein